MEEELDLTIDPREFKLPSPKTLDEDEQRALVRASLTRICDGAGDLQTQNLDPSEAQGLSPSDMWMLLLVRLVTRVADPSTSSDEDTGENKEANGLSVSELYDRQDRLRQTLCDYIMTDFSGRWGSFHGRRVPMNCTNDCLM